MLEKIITIIVGAAIIFTLYFLKEKFNISPSLITIGTIVVVMGIFRILTKD